MRDASRFFINDPRARRARTSEKQAQVLAWLATEPFSTVAILAGVIGLQRVATAKTLDAMQAAGLLRKEEIRTPLAGRVNLYVVTPHGAAMGSPLDGEPLPYFETGRIAPSTIEHALDVQRARLAARRAGWTAWQSDRELHALAGAAEGGWRKIPDALAINAGGVRVAVEVERTAKTSKRYEEILAQYLQQIRAGLCDAVHYVSPTPGLAARLQRIFLRIEQVPINGRRYEIKDEHRARLKFFELETWPPKAAATGEKQ